MPTPHPASEYEECRVFVEWMNMLGITYAHIPNETFTKSWKTKMRNKVMGVRPGVPDYLILTPKALLFIEMKRKKGGTVSVEQKRWVEQINTYAPKVSARVCRGAEEAIEFVKSNL